MAKAKLKEVEIAAWKARQSEEDTDREEVEKQGWEKEKKPATNSKALPPTELYSLW